MLEYMFREGMTERCLAINLISSKWRIRRVLAGVTEITAREALLIRDLYGVPIEAWTEPAHI